MRQVNEPTRADTLCQLDLAPKLGYALIRGSRALTEIVGAVGTRFTVLSQIASVYAALQPHWQF